MKYISLVFAILLSTFTVLGQIQPTGQPQSRFDDPSPGAPVANGADPAISLPTPYNHNGNPTLFNYKRLYTLRKPEQNASAINSTTPSSKAWISTQYADGWGRTLQTITHSSFDGDLVTLHDYRPATTAISYLPYTVATPGSQTITKFQPSPFTAQRSFYNNLYPAEPGSAISKKEYVSDFSIRSTNTFAEGWSNIGSSKGTTQTIFANMEDEVILFNNAPRYFWPTNSGYYPAGVLKKKITANADGLWVAEFTDMENRVICRKQLVGNTRITLRELEEGSPIPTDIEHYSDRYAWTYFVYDDFGRLRYTLSPKSIEKFVGNSWVFTNEIIENLTDYTEYDEKGRVEQKHMAGQIGNTYYVYDKKDRVVLSQTLQLKSEGKWQFNCYDNKDRVIMTGLVDMAMSIDSRENCQALMDNPISTNNSDILYYLYNEGQYFTMNAGHNGIISGPSGVAQVLTCSEYDKHGSGIFVIAGGQYDASDFIGHTVSTDYSVAPEISDKTLGLPTASRIKVLKPAGASLTAVQDWIWTYTYYDQFGRVIQTRTKNHSSGWDVVSRQYNFNGEVVREITNHRNLAATNKPNTEVEVVRDYNYQRKLVNTSEQIDGSSFRLVSSFTYDHLGRPRVKNIGQIENQNYEYNLRGQLTAINRNHITNPSGSGRRFGEIIGYDREFYNTYVNGKAAGMIWRGSGNSYAKAYKYSYDLAGRLTNADYTEQYVPSTPGTYPLWTNSEADYSEKDITYDVNGNIQTLKRYGPRFVSAPGLIDELEYFYKDNGVSNTLLYVSDAVGGSSLPYEFKDNNTSQLDYRFDRDGNMISDYNKALEIENSSLLNKPTKLTVGNHTTWYVYDALGNKLIEQHAGSKTDRFDFMMQALYKNNELQHVNNEEGYTAYNGTNTTVSYDKEIFYVRDHLGNVREVVQRHAGAIQGNDGPIEITFEPSKAPVESDFADLLSNLRDVKPLSFDPNDQYSALLDASDPQRRVGSVIMLNLRVGDRLRLSAETYSEALTEPIEDVTAEEMVGNIISSLTSEGGLGTDEGTMQFVSSMFDDNNYLTVFESLRNAQVNAAQPKSFLNYIFFDENMNIVPDHSGFIQAATTDGGGWETVSAFGGQSFEVTRNGTVIIYLEGRDGTKKTHWDNIKTEFYRGESKEDFHYYPFGNVVKGTSTMQQLKRYLYQSKELNTDDDLYLYDFHARQYDPQLARFTSLDPQNQFPSGYTGMGNSPVLNADPDGEFLIEMAIGAGIGLLMNGIQNLSSGENFFDGGFDAALAGGVTGILSFGVGNVFVGSKVFLTEVARAGVHGVSGGFMSGAQGGNFWSGALSGAISSGVGSGMTYSGIGNVNKYLAHGLGGGLSGGVGSVIGGGNFFAGFGQGMAVGLLNHAAHEGAGALGYDASGGGDGDGKKRPDADGKLTLEEANNWWSTGNGEPLTVDADKVNLRQISVTEFPKKGPLVLNMAGGGGASLNDALVYGRIRIKYIGNNKAVILQDKYDFDIKWKNILLLPRNIETQIGKWYAGPGQMFRINFRGTIDLTPKHFNEK